MGETDSLYRDRPKIARHVQHGWRDTNRGNSLLECSAQATLAVLLLSKLEVRGLPTSKDSCIRSMAAANRSSPRLVTWNRRRHSPTAIQRMCSSNHSRRRMTTKLLLGLTMMR